MALFGKEILSEDLITNGDFLVDSNWNKGVGWSIPGGYADCDGSQVAISNITQPNIVTADSLYKVSVELLNYSAGFIVMLVGNLSSTAAMASDGIYDYSIVAAGNATIIISANVDFVGSVRALRVKEVLSLTISDGDTLERQPNSEDKILNNESIITRLPWSEDYDGLTRQANSEDYLDDGGIIYSRMPNSEDYETDNFRFIRQPNSEDYKVEAK